jgi:hypothetical protein
MMGSRMSLSAPRGVRKSVAGEVRTIRRQTVGLKRRPSAGTLGPPDAAGAAPGYVCQTP